MAGAITPLSLTLGLVAKSARADLSGPRSATRFYARLGIHGRSASAYPGLAFLIVAALIALAARSRPRAARSPPADSSRCSSGRSRAGRGWAAVSASPPPRWSDSPAGRNGDVGRGGQPGTPVRFASVLGGGLNTMPPALCILGLGVLAMGIWPRATLFAAYGVLAWSFLIDVLGGSLNISHWILDTSVFHQMAPPRPRARTGRRAR